MFVKLDDAHRKIMDILQNITIIQNYQVMLPRLSTLSIPYEVDVAIPQHESTLARILKEEDAAGVSDRVLTCALCLATVHPGTAICCMAVHISE